MGQSKQDIVVGMVQEGKFTRKEIKDAAECTTGALATYLSGMRNAAKYTKEPICPFDFVEVRQDDEGNEVKVKILKVCSFEEYEAKLEEAKANAATRGSAKTPEQRVADAEKAIAKHTKAADGYKARNDENPSEELELREQRARIDVRLAEIALSVAEALISPTAQEDDLDPETDDEMA